MTSQENPFDHEENSKKIMEEARRDDVERVKKFKTYTSRTQKLIDRIPNGPWGIISEREQGDLIEKIENLNQELGRLTYRIMSNANSEINSNIIL